MSAGDILREEDLIVEALTVKSGEDIEKGEICFNDGAGMIAASISTTVLGPYYMALVDHDYSAESTHVIGFVKKGFVEVQKSGATAILEGEYVEIGSTAGEVQVSDLSVGEYQGVGACTETIGTTETTVKIHLGQMP